MNINRNTYESKELLNDIKIDINDTNNELKELLNKIKIDIKSETDEYKELINNLNENIDKIENDMDSLTIECNKFQALLKRRIELLNLIEAKNEN
jgi:sugar-specific transcriptional regulator TrmB